MNAVDHNNVVIFDDRGIPSIMCRFVRPKDTEEVPAVFKIGDKVADAIYISKYQNIVIDGRAYSMPMADPTVNITFDGAVQACRCKGLGWHLMTAVEYEYLLNQSREKGTMPHGNTDWGKDYYHNDEQGKVSNLGRTYTGTGPVTWNHDHTPYGVSDLNGNVWEWLAGLRIKDGVIEFIPDNKAASPYCDLSKDSAEWQQAETSKGRRIITTLTRGEQCHREKHRERLQEADSLYGITITICRELRILTATFGSGPVDYAL